MCPDFTTTEHLPIARDFWRYSEMSAKLYDCDFIEGSWHACNGTQSARNGSGGFKFDNYGDGLCSEGYTGPLCG